MKKTIQFKFSIFSPFLPLFHLYTQEPAPIPDKPSMWNR
jgi:hypothetical protein